MPNQGSFYRVFPRVVGVGRTVRIRIEPRFPHVYPPPDSVPAAEIVERETRLRQPLPADVAERAVTITFTPAAEQEYALRLHWRRGEETVRSDEFTVYAVGRDLLPMRAWKGDVHQHSNRSDGRESPPYVAGACRRTGMDFMALTDHRLYEPSLEAAHAFADLGLEFRIYPGEEIHPPENPVHMVHFGGGFSIQALFAQEALYRKGLERFLSRPRLDLPEPDRRVYASCAWVFEQIRSAGGIGILCHPYWLTGDAYNITESLQAALYAHRPFDALEAVGGFYRHQMESNALAVCRWQEERARGAVMPLVGVSDAHGCETGELLGWYYTLVFAPSPDFADLRSAILDGRCVAVEAVPGEFPRLYGPFRLVKFGYFLLRTVLPLHDEICAEEGRWMLAYLAGETEGGSFPGGRKDRVAELYGRLWER
ncbi:MAG: PHP domain-containing protein [Lentisphaeria bacterium]|nr:PHP domain-containing protein [Lentisphaeria bacterium]